MLPFHQNVDRAWGKGLALRPLPDDVGQGSSVLILMAPERFFADKSELNLAGKPGTKRSASLSIAKWRGLDQVTQTKGSVLLPNGMYKLTGHIAQKLKQNLTGKRARTLSVD